MARREPANRTGLRASRRLGRPGPASCFETHRSAAGPAQNARRPFRAAMLLRLYVPSLEEATHPRCGCEGYPE